MRLPLILGARPQFSTKGPVVMVPEGSWKVTSEGIVSSKLRLELTFAGDLLQTLDIDKDSTPSFQGLCKAELKFSNRGNEDFISIFADSK